MVLRLSTNNAMYEVQFLLDIQLGCTSIAESSQLTSHKKQINKTFRQICL